MIRVLKFGGTSMGDDGTWRNVLEIIARYTHPVVIVSATARTTRQLTAAAGMAVSDLEQAREITAAISDRHIQLIKKFLQHHAKVKNQEQNCITWIDTCITDLNDLLAEVAGQKQLTPALKDAIASIGEQLSARLFSICAKAYGLPAQWVDARNIIKTDSTFGQATPDESLIKKNAAIFSDLVKKRTIPIMGGFYGEDENSAITTLGFEGSDYTASLVGAALGAEAIEIWTDVSGIYTCDPRVVKEAQSIPELTFKEATELAYFGAKVLHPSTMKPAAAVQIPVYVKNIFEPDHPGTKIHEKESQQGWAKAMAYLSGITLLTVTSNGARQGHQFLNTFFSVLHDAHITVNTVTTTEASVSVALQHDVKTSALEHKLQSLGTVKTESAHGLISIIGCSFGDMDALNRQVLSAIPNSEVSLISYSKTRQNLNIALPETELIPAVCRIHKTLFAKGSSV